MSHNFWGKLKINAVFFFFINFPIYHTSLLCVLLSHKWFYYFISRTYVLHIVICYIQSFFPLYKCIDLEQLVKDYYWTSQLLTILFYSKKKNTQKFSSINTSTFKLQNYANLCVLILLSFLYYMYLIKINGNSTFSIQLF